MTFRFTRIYIEDTETGYVCHQGEDRFICC